MPTRAFSHTHEQLSPSDTWTIIHNLGTLAPAVDVFVDVDGTVQKIIPASVTVVSDSTVTVTFSIARTGTAAIR